jgi:hypothetical protein
LAAAPLVCRPRGSAVYATGLEGQLIPEHCTCHSDACSQALFRASLHIKTEMIQMIYEKSLRVTGAIKAEMGAGAIANLQSNDASKIWCGSRPVWCMLGVCACMINLCMGERNTLALPTGTMNAASVRVRSGSKAVEASSGFTMRRCKAHRCLHMLAAGTCLNMVTCCGMGLSRYFNWCLEIGG